MFLPIEDLKEFLAMLETEENKADVPVFLDKNQITTETGMLVGEIIIQYQYDTNMLAVFKTHDGIDPVMLPNQQFFNALEYYTDKPTVEKAQSKAKAMVEKQEAQLEAEYNKAVELLNKSGFETIIPYAWSE